ncbi:MAG: PilZ domain-containing protein [Planctomycetota bacterium]|jgi:hypothetical protein
MEGYERKYDRHRPKSGTTAKISANDSGMNTEGLLINISRGGAYIMAESIPFETAWILFAVSDDQVVETECKRVDAYKHGVHGLAVQFTEELTAGQLEAIKDKDCRGL